MEEQELEIRTNGQYKNITIKTRYDWDGQNKCFKFDTDGNKIIKEQGIKPGHQVIIEKVFAEGYEVKTKYGSVYSCKVLYKDEEVTFWLTNDFLHNNYKNCGGIGDKIKVSCTIEQILNKRIGMPVPTEVLKFEKLE